MRTLRVFSLARFLIFQPRKVSPSITLKTVAFSLAIAEVRKKVSKREKTRDYVLHLLNMRTVNLSPINYNYHNL